MADFGLADLWLIVRVGGAIVVCLIGGIFAIAAWPKLVAGLTAMLDTRNERRPLVRFARAAGENMSSISNTADDDYVAEPARMVQTDSRQTDRQPVSEPQKTPGRLQLNKTRTAVIEELLTHGWNVGEIRNVVKGDNGAIGAEIDAARQRLGIEVEPRTIPVKERGGDTRYVALDESLGILKP